MHAMLEGGEDPKFIVRRMIVFASEDIGNADPRALLVATSALQALELVGLPEGVLPLSQAVTYLAMAPKSNASYRAWGLAREAVQQHGPLPVPLHLRNAPTRLMKSLGYGAGYQYPHDFEGNVVAEQYLPEALRGARYYRPSASGEEAAHADRLEALLRLRAPKEPGEDG
jgi:putative ATPase